MPDVTKLIKCTFGDLANGEQFFDPFCGEYFVKLACNSALMLSGGAGDDDDADTFYAHDDVERLSAEETPILRESVLARIEK